MRETWMQLKEFKCSHCSLSWKLKSLIHGVFKTVCTFIKWPNIFQRMLNIFRSLPVGAFKDYPTSKETMFYCYYKTPIILFMPLIFAWFIYLLDLCFHLNFIFIATQQNSQAQRRSFLQTAGKKWKINWKQNNRGAMNLRYIAFAT